MDDLIRVFFTKEYENNINEKLIELNYSFDKNEFIESYISALNSIPVEDYLKWIENDFTTIILSYSDAVQYSSLDDALMGVVEKMIGAGDEGYTHYEIGILLQDDGKQRSVGTNTKYGENHAKTSKYLGYLFSIENFYYVSCIGYSVDKLKKDDELKLYSRLFMRTPLFRVVYLMSKNGDVKMKKIFDFLSDNTYIRRKNNIKNLFDRLKEDESYDWEGLLKKIRY